MPKNLLYKPKLGYKKNYYTEGDFQEAINDNSSFDNPLTLDLDKLEIIDMLKDNIDKKLNFLPNDINSIYLSPYKVMDKEYNKIKEEINKENDKEPENTDEDDSNNYIDEDDSDEDDDFPEDFRSDNDVYIDVQDPRADKVEYIKNKYKDDFIEIYEDYLKNTSNSLDNYIYTFLQDLNFVSEKNPNFGYNSSNVKNKDLLHLTDFLAKTDIVIDQRLRLHKKLFDIDESILHIRQLKIAKAMVERYSGQSELKQEISLDVDSNILLKESIRVAEKKYDNCLVSLYKYLNSSNDQLEESLKILIKKNKSNMTINYKER